jgi:hypothetical protein
MKTILLRSLETLEPNLVQKTGQKAEKSGIYRSDKQYIALTKNERFPPSETNVWKIVVSI